MFLGSLAMVQVNFCQNGNVKSITFKDLQLTLQDRLGKKTVNFDDAVNLTFV